MAIHYVDSAAVGTNAGTSWTNAWTSLGSSVGIATSAGDIVYVDDGHSEPSVGQFIWDWSSGTWLNPVRVICVDKSDDSLSTMDSGGGSIVNTAAEDMTFRGQYWFYGLKFNCADNITILSNSENVRWENCHLTVTDLVNFDGAARLEMVDCVIDNNDTGTPRLSLSSSQEARFINCTFFPSFKQSASGFCQASTGNVLFYGCDLTNVSDDLCGSATTDTEELLGLTFKNCLLPSGYSLTASGTLGDTYLKIEGCSNGTISAPPLINERESRYGKVESVLTQYRTGGADDGEQANAYSWKMVSTSEAAEGLFPLRAWPMVRWVEAGSQTLTVYVAGGADLYDDDFWVEVSSPNETTSPNQTGQGNFQSTRMAYLATPVVLVRSTGTVWDGAGTGVDGGAGQQKIDISINPTEPGPVTVNCFLAKPSTTVFVDPKIGVA